MPNCVACGEEAGGTYGTGETAIPACLDCYNDGRIAVWLKENRPEAKVATHVRFKVEALNEGGVVVSLWVNGTMRTNGMLLSEEEMMALSSALIKAENIWFHMAPLEKANQEGPQ